MPQLARPRRAIPRLIVTATVVAAGVAFAPQAGAHTATRVIDLGSLSGTRGTSSASAINDRGEIVGNTAVPSHHSHAFLWRHGHMIDLGTLGGGNSYATDINARGTVVGYSETRTGSYRAFVWQHGRMHALPGMKGAASYAMAINDRGQIVGASGPGNVRHAVMWSHGRMTVLGSASVYGWAYGINDHGQVVGESAPDGMNQVPRLWTRHSTRTLATYGSARAINDRGQVAGYDYRGRSFLWYRGDATWFTVNGGDPTAMTQAASINRRGQIAGASGFYAWIWHHGTVTVLPFLPAGPYAAARDINNHGMVVGEAATVKGGSYPHAVLWIVR